MFSSFQNKFLFLNNLRKNLSINADKLFPISQKKKKKIEVPYSLTNSDCAMSPSVMETWITTDYIAS